MRLRLTVQRNGLPAANILWSVPDTNSGTAYTVTRLLEDVNHIMPLEAEHWGLEHYVVEVAGFECLHFSPVVQALKEDDHVSIRPLMTAEVRARTLTGRHQISDDGRHLVDGVPFGKPYLRRSNRPAIRIPPSKRRRLDDADTEEQGEVMGFLTAAGEDEHEEAAGSAAVEGETQPRVQASASKNGSRKVHFQQTDLGVSDDSEDEDDEDFAPGGSESDIAMDDDSEVSSSAHDRSDSESSPSEDSSDSDSDSDSESDASSPPDVMSSKLVPPGQGLKATASRNARRAHSSRLRRLKEAGRLPENADLSDLRNYDAGGKDMAEAPTSSKPLSNVLGKRTRLDDDDEDDEDDQDHGADDGELERRKHELMKRLGQESGTSTIPIDSKDLTVSTAGPEAPPSLPQPVPDKVPTKSAAQSKRLRPDVSVIGRILRHQTRPLVPKAERKPVVKEAPEPEGASDPDFWKSRINLSAFECWDEDFELTAPPFPFEQHWDSASKLMREKAIKKKQKKLEKNRNSFPVEETTEEDTIILDYDEAPAIELSDANISAAIEDQLLQDVEAAAQTDLPPLPEDISSLEQLKPSDIKEGAVIVCKFWTLHPNTFAPEISDFKTALVEREGDSGNGAGTIRLRIAKRDLPKKEIKFDRHGNRIPNTGDAFFMGDDEAEEDEDLWEGSFAELLEGKLLQAAEPSYNV